MGGRRRGLLVWGRRGGLVLLSALVVEYAVLPQLAGARAAVRLLDDVSPAYLAAGLALELLSLLGYSALTRTVLPRAGRPRFATLLRVDLSALGLSHLVPGGGATANGLRYRLLTVAGMRPADVVAAAALQATGLVAMLAVLFVVGVGLALQGGQDTPSLLLGAGLAVTLLCLVGAATAGLHRRPEAASSLVLRVARRLPRVDPPKAARAVTRLSGRLEVLLADRRHLARMVGWATANWGFDLVSLWVFLRAFGPVPGWQGLVLGYGLAGLVALLPLSPGGLGTVEATLVSVLVASGLPHTHALLGVITWRLAEFWLPIPLAAISYLSLRTGALRAHRLPARPLVPRAASLPGVRWQEPPG